MPETKAATLDLCGKAVLVAYGRGEITDDEKRDVEAGYRLLLMLIFDLINGDLTYYDNIVQALHDVHPGANYCQAMVIRDIADVCVTLDRLKNGKERSDRTKVMEANTLCFSLKAEFREIPKTS